MALTFKIAVATSLLAHAVFGWLFVTCLQLGPRADASWQACSTLTLVAGEDDPITTPQADLEEKLPLAESDRHDETEASAETIPPEPSLSAPQSAELSETKTAPAIVMQTPVSIPAPKEFSLVKDVATRSDFGSNTTTQLAPLALLQPGAGETSRSTITDGVESATRPGYLFAPKPKYPASARRRKQEGWVLISAQIDASGHPTNVKLGSSCGYVLLDRAALETIETWRFTAATLNHTSVSSVVEIPIRFQLSRQ